MRVNAWIGTAAIVCAALMFGFAPPLARLAYLSGSNPATLLTIRLALGSAILLTILAGRFLVGRPRLGRASPCLLLLVGLSMAGSTGAYMSSVKFIPAGVSSLLFYTFPVQVILLAWAMREESLTAARLLASLACLVGVGLAVGVAPVAPDPFGVALALTSAAGVAAMMVLGGRAMRDMDAMAVQTIATIFSACCYAVWLVLSGGPDWPSGESAMGWIALLGSAGASAVAMILFMFGVSRIGAGRAAMLANLEPVVVLALSPILLDEHLTAIQLGGAALVIAAITILPVAEARKSRAKHSI